MKHHRSIIFLHWLTGLLVFAAFAIILYRAGLDDGDQRKFWLDTHRVVGLSVLGLVIIRALARVTWGREPVVSVPPVLHLLSVLGQFAMYAIMVMLPLLGWAQSSARARHFKLFDVVLPSIEPHDADRADMLADWHETLAWVFLAIIGIHVAAALWHHFGRKDAVLRSMLPGKSD